MSDCITLEGPTALHFCWLTGKQGLCVSSRQCIELHGVTQDSSSQLPETSVPGPSYLIHLLCLNHSSYTVAQAGESRKKNELHPQSKFRQHCISTQANNSLGVLTPLHIGAALVPEVPHDRDHSSAMTEVMRGHMYESVMSSQHEKAHFNRSLMTLGTSFTHCTRVQL